MHAFKGSCAIVFRDALEYDVANGVLVGMILDEVPVFLVLRHLTVIHSGAATTASRLGQPDLAMATLNDFVEVRTIASFGLITDTYMYSKAAATICSLDPTKPVIADADTGYT